MNTQTGQNADGHHHTSDKPTSNTNMPTQIKRNTAISLPVGSWNGSSIADLLPLVTSSIAHPLQLPNRRFDLIPNVIRNHDLAHGAKLLLHCTADNLADTILVHACRSLPTSAGNVKHGGPFR